MLTKEQRAQISMKLMALTMKDDDSPEHFMQVQAGTSMIIMDDIEKLTMRVKELEEVVAGYMPDKGREDKDILN